MCSPAALQQPGGEVVDDAPATHEADERADGDGQDAWWRWPGGHRRRRRRARRRRSSAAATAGRGRCRPTTGPAAAPSAEGPAVRPDERPAAAQGGEHHAAAVRRSARATRWRAARAAPSRRMPAAARSRRSSARGRRSSQATSCGGRRLVDDVGEAEGGEAGGPDDLLAPRRAAGHEHRADAGGEALERGVVAGHLHDPIGAGEQRPAARGVAHEADAVGQPAAGRARRRRSTTSRRARRPARRAAPASPRTRRGRGGTPPRRRPSRRPSRRAARARDARAAGSTTHPQYSGVSGSPYSATWSHSTRSP